MKSNQSADPLGLSSGVDGAEGDHRVRLILKAFGYDVMINHLKRLRAEALEELDDLRAPAAPAIGDQDE